MSSSSLTAPVERRPAAIALIDGEHYPQVVADALRSLADRFVFKGALFLGGLEKIKSGDLEAEALGLYGVPVLFDRDPRAGLARALAEFQPEVVVDLSDEPVVGYEQRFCLISESLARNVSYVGSDFQFSPARAARLCISPSLSIVGTGKRVGKTAVSGYVARTLKDKVNGIVSGPPVVVVAMGRGGPAEPEIVNWPRQELTVKELLALSRQGRHAASDHFEDALLSQVVTVGCRRCGGGMAGEPFVSNVVEGVLLANSLNPGFMVLEGSGAAYPPVATDARLLVAGAHQPVAHVAGLLGAYRLLTSDAVLLTMAEEPMATGRKVAALSRAIRKVRPEMPVLPVVFRPRPLEDVRGRKVAFFTTASAGPAHRLCAHLEEEFGCVVVFCSGNLARRGALVEDLHRPEMAAAEAVLTEIKAAAIDVVAEEAAKRGLPVIPVDNTPVEAAGETSGALADLVGELTELAIQRFKRGA
ncbi:MAG: 2,3-diphosphoglycerate synthetase [Thermoleophilia bacterium]|nr:2,3-diphosphoglycerate synthetase [Thermoleophilia bacterium]